MTDISPWCQATRSPALDSRKSIGNVVTFMSDQLDRDIQPDSRFVVMDDMKVHHKRIRTGPTVLLPHGSASSPHGMEAAATLLD
ncbi:hypothetical protein ACRS5S_03300 [Nocardia asiatica]|uniref:hypothetical protein n=1 Tax=Nocardia asiatica TaxID=209252 RepID=UPI003EE00293